MPKEPKEITPQQIAEWMIATVEKDGALYQDHAVSSIILNFGEEFSYLNDNGNQAIHRDILKIFRKISDNIVIWDRGERMWRLRDKFDAPGRMQE